MWFQVDEKDSLVMILGNWINRLAHRPKQVLPSRPH